MKKYIISLLLFIFSAGCLSVHAQSGNEKLFPYPTAPEDIANLHSRCNYLVYHFWDRCNFKTAFSSVDRLNSAFGDWMMFVPHATADTVHIAVDQLISKLSKSGPQTLKMAEIAEGWLYSDTAEIFSEEVYLPFARAAAGHKKIQSASRERFRMQVKQIESSGLGATLPAVPFVRPDGSKGSTSEAKTDYTLIFINDPDCDDCSLASLRMSVNPDIKELTERGILSIVSLYGGEPGDKAWKDKASSLPAGWIAGANPDLDLIFDIRTTPSYFLLDGNHKVIAKNIQTDNLLNAFAVMNMQSKIQQ